MLRLKPLASISLHRDDASELVGVSEVVERFGQRRHVGVGQRVLSLPRLEGGVAVDDQHLALGDPLGLDFLYTIRTAAGMPAP